MKKEISPDNLFNNMLSAIATNIVSDGTLGIIEFAEDILFNGDEAFKLYPTQKAVLKAFYNEPLNEDELSILEEWFGQDKTTWIRDRIYNNLILEAGRRGSKSTCASIIALKEFYDLITLRNPSKKYGLLPNSPIAIFVIAQSEDQVKETIFATIKGYAENSHYFKGLVENKFIEILDKEIRCPAKNTGIYAKHTNSKSLVGYSIKCLIIDEAARFETSKETGQNNAFIVYDNVGKGVSAFGENGRKVVISSAWEVGDPMVVFYERSQKDNRTLGLRLTTFDLNLRMIKGVTPVVVTDYINDYTNARLEYEGIRSSKHNTFIPRENVEKAATGICCIDAEPCELDIEVNNDLRHYVGVKVNRLERKTGLVSFVHIDPALKKDSAALAIARSVRLPDGRWAIQIDGVLRWEPIKNKKGLNRVVSFLDLENKLLDICKARGVQKVTFDSWNSASLIQKLHVKGVSTMEMSSSREKQLEYYSLFKELLSQGLIILPRDSLWSTNLITEISELVKRPNGQIIHPNAPKDLADAICLAIYNCFQYQVSSGMSSLIYSGVSSLSSNNTTPSKGNNMQKLSIGSKVNNLYKARKRI